MHILVTGATGFIGSHLAEQLHQNSYTLRCLIRKNSNRQWIKNIPIEYIEGDYTDPISLRKAVAGVDFIYHSAGVTKSKNKIGYFQGNHIATKNLLEAVRKTNTNLSRFIHISSQAAVGPSSINLPIDETTPFHPITTYGLSKMEAEKECHKYMNDFPITIVRPPAVYGPRDTDVFEFFNTMNKGLQPMIGFGKTYVSLVHVKDLVRGIVLAGESPRSIGQSYFIASERFYNWQEIGEVTQKLMNKNVFRVHIPKSVVFVIAAIAEFGSLFSSKPALLNIEKAKDITQDHWTCSIQKAKEEIGYRESFKLVDGISDTLAWYKANGWLK